MRKRVNPEGEGIVKTKPDVKQIKEPDVKSNKEHNVQMTYLLLVFVFVMK